MGFMEIILYAIGLLVAVTIHECSHAYIADKLGDPTPRLMGRLTLSPWPHIDPVGLIMLLLVHFGWGKPVQINPRYFRSPMRDQALVAMAGPVSNFATAFVLALVLRGVGWFLPDIVSLVLLAIVEVSIMLGVFNLLPLPPLDGSKVLGLIVPRRWNGAYTRFLAEGQVFTILFIVFDSVVLRQMGHSLLEYTIGNLSLLIKGVMFLGG